MGNTITKSCTRLFVCSRSNNGSQDDVTDDRLKPRGRLVIFNLKQFAPGHGERTGTEFDEKRLLDLFGPNGFNYVITVHNDNKMVLTKDRILEEIRNLAGENFAGNFNLVCVIMTHGKKGLVVCGDGDTISIADIVTPFAERNCRSLRNKEKIFIFQCCQGNKYNYGGSIREKDGANCVLLAETQDELLGPDAVAPTEPGLSFANVPPLKNCVIAFSTFPGDLSWRNTGSGSQFIQHLCDEIEKTRSSDIETILRLTANRIAYEFKTFRPIDKELEAEDERYRFLFERVCLQIPCYISMVDHKVYFRGPVGRQQS